MLVRKRSLSVFLADLVSVCLTEDRPVKAPRRRAVRKKRRKLTLEEEEEGGASDSKEEEEEEEAGAEVEIDRQLDQSLETKSKQHNLTTVNVRNIIHVSSSNQKAVLL